MEEEIQIFARQNPWLIRFKPSRAELIWQNFPTGRNPDISGFSEVVHFMMIGAPYLSESCRDG